MGSSEAAFCGVLQSRRGDASRWARLRRLPTGFSNGGAARSAAVPFCPSLPRRLAVLLSLPSRPASDAARHFSCIHLSRRAAGTAPLSLPPARTAEQCAPFSPYRRRARHCTSFSTPRRPGNGCRASVPAHANRRAVPTLFHIFPRARVMLLPLPCRPANDTAHGRRGDARQRARPRRLSAGFCRAAAAVLPVGLVRGGFPRGFPTAALRAAPPFPFVLLSPATRGTDAARPFPPMRTGGQSLPFSTFSYRPVVLLSLPSRPASDTAHGRRGDASRWARPRRLFAGFCRAAEAMLPVGLV